MKNKEYTVLGYFLEVKYVIQMLPEVVRKVLQDAGEFPDLFKSGLEEKLHEELYKSKQIVHAAGQIELSLYLIESGFARSYYYDHNGQEHTVKFHIAGEVIFSYEGYYKVPSFYYTEFMESSRVIAFSYPDLFELQRRFSDMAILIKYAFLKNRREEYEKQYLLTLPAKERYERLLHHNHIIFQFSPAKFIASYLNMSRETLARLMGKG